MNWIPVSERLPESRQLIKCRIKGEQGYVGKAKYLKSTNKAVTRTKFSNRTEIIQWKFDEWMPLPEPPKETV